MSERPSATHSTCSFSSSCVIASLSTLVHRLPLDHRCKILSPSFPPSQPPAFPLSPFAYYFSFVLRATTINTQPQPHGISTPPIHSLAPFSSILLTFLYNFPIRSAQRRPVYPPLYKTAPSLPPVLDYVVGTLAVFKLPPLKDGISIHSLVSILSCVFPLFFRVRSHLRRLVSGTRARGTAVHLVSPFDSTGHPLSCLSPNLLLPHLGR